MAKRGGKSDKKAVKKTAPKKAKKATEKKPPKRKFSPETQRVLDTLHAAFEDGGDHCLLADGLEDALIGWVQIFNKRIALYDREKCIEALVAQGMDHEDAEEFFEYNTIGAYVGDKTPAFATIVRDRPDSMYAF